MSILHTIWGDDQLNTWTKYLSPDHLSSSSGAQKHFASPGIIINSEPTSSSFPRSGNLLFPSAIILVEGYRILWRRLGGKCIENTTSSHELPAPLESRGSDLWAGVNSGHWMRRHNSPTVIQVRFWLSVLEVGWLVFLYIDQAIV